MLTAAERTTVAESEDLAREYFAGNEPPLCGRCGEELLVRIDYGSRPRLSLEMSCSGCGKTWKWQQTDSPGRWDALHVNYFLERTRQNRVPRCPFDDSSISFAEFEGGIIEFRCPFCNRRGRGNAGEGPEVLHLNENESIVFLMV